MPFVSRAQARIFAMKEHNGELPKGTYKRWAAHTKDMKKLPDHKGDEKRAFVAAFIVKCAAAGITDPAAVAAEAVRQTKLALDVAGTTGDALGRAAVLPLIGSVGLPLAAGFAGGSLLGTARNAADEDDAETLRVRAMAHEYKRRAAMAQAAGQVRQLVASDPRKYVPIG